MKTLYGSQVEYTFEQLITAKHAKRPYRLRFKNREGEVVFEKFYPTFRGAESQGSKLSKTKEYWECSWSTTSTTSPYFFREFNGDQRTQFVKDAGYTILDAWSPFDGSGIEKDKLYTWTREWNRDNEKTKIVFKFTHISAEVDGRFSLSVSAGHTGYTVGWDEVVAAWNAGDIAPLATYDWDVIRAEYQGKLDAWASAEKQKHDVILDKARTFTTMTALEEYIHQQPQHQGIQIHQEKAPSYLDYMVSLEHRDQLYTLWDKAYDADREMREKYRETLNNIASNIIKKESIALPETTPREIMIKQFAAQGLRQPVEKYLDRIVAAIESKDAQAVYDVAHTSNKATRAGFTKITGVALGRTRKEDLAILKAWAGAS